MIHAAARPLPSRRFPAVATGVLLALCIAPLVALFGLEAVLSRNCTTVASQDGTAGSTLVWRIETVKCGDGPAVDNVLLAPRGKSFALVASSTGAPRPLGVTRDEDGTTRLILQSRDGKAAGDIVLALKATGRPAKPLVLHDGQPKP